MGCRTTYISEGTTIHLYVAASRTTEVEYLRYQLFCAKGGEIESSLLPLCRDCLFSDLIRANYQAAIWKCSLPARPTVPNPNKCGLICDDGKLAIHWMRSPTAPCAVLELLACKCVRSCRLPKCTCMANGLAWKTCASCSHAVARNSRKMTSSNLVIQTMK